MKANLNERDSIDNTCVHLAAQGGALNCVKYLVEELSFHLDNCLNRYQMTPLHSACKNNQFNVAKYLIERNINVKQLDINGRSAYDIAKNGRYTECIDLLS
jgi:ankyrin repeat protein